MLALPSRVCSGVAVWRTLLALRSQQPRARYPRAAKGAWSDLVRPRLQYGGGRHSGHARWTCWTCWIESTASPVACVAGVFWVKQLSPGCRPCYTELHRTRTSTRAPLALGRAREGPPVNLRCRPPTTRARWSTAGGGGARDVPLDPTCFYEKLALNPAAVLVSSYASH